MSEPKEQPVRKTSKIPKPTHFGKNLRFLRRLRGISQTALSKELKMTRNKIASYESGLVEPSAQQFLLTCNFFGVNPREMLDSILSEDPLKKINLDLRQKSDADYLSEQMTSFIHQTNEMTKIYEGYRAFYDIKSEVDASDDQKALYQTIHDLLDLLKSLLSSNWNLFQPNDEEE